MLGDRHGDPRDINLLKGITSQQIIGNIAGNGHHGNGVHIGCRNTGNQIGSARSAGCQTDPAFAGASRIAVCRMGCPLLM